MSTIEALREQITHEERVANLAPNGAVTAAEIHRRRLQIFLVALLVLVGLLFTTVANDVWTELRDNSWVDPRIARVALIVFGAWWAVYVYDKEQHLKRLTRLGRDVERLDGELAAGLLRAAVSAEAVAAVHASLDLDETVRHVVEQGAGLVGAALGSLRLLDEDGHLRPAARAEDGAVPTEASDDLVQLASQEEEPVLLSSGDVSVLCAPLRCGSELLGVLVLAAAERGRFSEGDRLLLHRFSGAAATALEHARRFEAAMFLLDEAVDPDQMLKG